MGVEGVEVVWKCLKKGLHGDPEDYGERIRGRVEVQRCGSRGSMEVVEVEVVEVWKSWKWKSWKWGGNAFRKGVA